MVKIQQHLGKITWTVVDKILFVLYGFVNLFQIRFLHPEEFGLYTLLFTMQTWIFIVSDGLALFGIVQYGAKEENRPQVNYIAGTIHITLTIFISLLIYALRFPFANTFHLPQLAHVTEFLPLFILLTIPRTFCLKLLQRDLQMKEIFWMNAVWFGVRIILTVWRISTKHTLDFQDMILIDFTGMGASSLAAMWFTRGMLRFGRSGPLTFREYLGFGGPIFVINLFNNFIRYLDVFVVQFFFSVGAVGIYQSAKTLYRAFDQAFDAVVSLFYPGAVKLIAAGRREDLNALVSKILSFTFVPVAITVLLLEAGLSRWVIELFLQKKYLLAVDQFNILALAALFMPFMILSSLVVALGATKILFRNIVLSSIVGFGVFILVGISQISVLIPLGVVIYVAMSGILNFMFVKRELDFPTSTLFRSVTDTKNFALAAKKKFLSK